MNCTYHKVFIYFRTWLGWIKQKSDLIKALFRNMHEFLSWRNNQMLISRKQNTDGNELNIRKMNEIISSMFQCWHEFTVYDDIKTWRSWIASVSFVVRLVSKCTHHLSKLIKIHMFWFTFRNHLLTLILSHRSQHAKLWLLLLFILYLLY